MRETRLHPGLIQLADVKGEFKRVHGDRLVFVITGVAINNAPVPVAGIQIQGRVIGGEDRRQIVYAGAAPQDVVDLGIREIELLQTLKPSSDWVLRPGEQDRFLVAFVEPTLPLSEFGAEVIAVRGYERPRRGGRSRSDDAELARRARDYPSGLLGFGFGRARRRASRRSRAAPSGPLERLTPLPRLPITSGSRPAPKTTRTMTSTMTSSPMPRPNMGRIIGEGPRAGKLALRRSCQGVFLYSPASMLQTFRDELRAAPAARREAGPLPRQRARRDPQGPRRASPCASRSASPRSTRSRSRTSGCRSSTTS